ncbi:glutamate 5-kinase [Pleomorphomonas koreensis]|uniref:glutamate 5-kinase n=1 Tax=Pleomorphomonas koreensis TaxID=257440 RepID=UPI000418408A|nr:glutamate 5-kinase [Pleomorphomonas koreensis]
MTTIEAFAGPLSGYRRVVIKIGSALLVEGRGTLKRGWMESVAADVARLRASGAGVLLVSSGAIAMGRGVLKLPKGRLKLEDSQAAAAVGQIALARAWAEVLGDHGITAGQILLTLGDTEERRRYLNGRATIGKLLKLGAVPVINENDTVATTEIRYGDNDRLAARVAAMMGADLLVLLSDIDGLYTAPPQADPDARLIPVIDRITPEIEAMAGGAASELSRGGMKTKIDAGKIATVAGAAMIIASGKVAAPLSRIDAGGPHSLFRPEASPVTARKAWIVGHIDAPGVLTIDAGAVKALKQGRSLLPPGVTRVDGDFHRGDTVIVVDEAGNELARGLVAYDAVDARRIRGQNSAVIETILGAPGRTEMIHRDDLVLKGDLGD